MIRAVVYDLDGMLFKEPHYFTKELESKYGIPQSETLFSKKKQYDRCKCGEISLDTFLQPYMIKWQKYPKFSLTIEQLKEEWFGFAKIQKDVRKIATRLKDQGIANVIATNNSRERIVWLDKEYALREEFTILGSYDVGELKPSKGFYSTLLAKLKLEPNEILWCDDKEDTIRALHEQGFAIYHFTTVEAFERDLKQAEIFK